MKSVFHTNGINVTAFMAEPNLQWPQRFCQVHVINCKGLTGSVDVPNLYRTMFIVRIQGFDGALYLIPSWNFTHKDIACKRLPSKLQVLYRWVTLLAPYEKSLVQCHTTRQNESFRKSRRPTLTQQLYLNIQYAVYWTTPFGKFAITHVHASTSMTAISARVFFRTILARCGDCASIQSPETKRLQIVCTQRGVRQPELKHPAWRNQIEQESIQN